MSVRTIKLLGPAGELLATGQVDWEQDRFTGQFDLQSMPAAPLQLFQEFEELVNDQILSLLDDIEQRIRDLGVKVGFDDGRVVVVENLQIYPSTGLASFKAVSLEAEQGRIARSAQDAIKK
jgi:hypothetical protein